MVEVDLVEAQAIQNPESLKSVSVDWSMFKKEMVLGHGAFGTCYRVKAQSTSIISNEGGREQRVLMNSTKQSLKRKLGIGGKSGVNMASDDKVRSLIADNAYVVKVIDTSKIPKNSALEALMEIDLLASITDCNFIVGYVDSFIENTEINIVMDYCQHGDLCTYIRKQNGKPFVENFVWKVFIHICLGLHYLHSRDIIHRDLKSLNVFLTKDNSAKIGDLGASRRLDANGQIINQFPEAENVKVGTPFYLAPEIWQDKPCSKKSDIWALGVLLYEIVAQHFPWEAEEIAELEQKIMTQKYQQLPNTANKSFVSIIQKCLVRKPEVRVSIDEIIKSNEFQQKCTQLRIALPLELNMEKQLRKIAAAEHPSKEPRPLLQSGPEPKQLGAAAQIKKWLLVTPQSITRNNHFRSNSVARSHDQLKPIQEFKTNQNLSVLRTKPLQSIQSISELPLSAKTYKNVQSRVFTNQSSRQLQSPFPVYDNISPLTPRGFKTPKILQVKSQNLAVNKINKAVTPFNPKTEKTFGKQPSLQGSTTFKQDKRKVPMTPSNITNIMFKEETKPPSKVGLKPMLPRSRAQTARQVSVQPSRRTKQKSVNINLTAEQQLLKQQPTEQRIEEKTPEPFAMANDADLEMEFETEDQLKCQRTQSLLYDVRPFFQEQSFEQIIPQQNEELMLEDEFIQL